MLPTRIPPPAPVLGPDVAADDASALPEMLARGLQLDSGERKKKGKPGKISDVASVPMDLGMWRAEEVQICRLGSWGPENEYVSVGGVKL